LYQVSGGTPTASMTSFGGIDMVGLADSISLIPEDHVHYNLAFTELGTYNVEFEISGEHVSNGTETATGTFTFNVVPEPSTFSLLALGMGFLAAFRRISRR
ncbi:MAG: TIGR03769 domain-containing protein, partial [Verrucomicrobiota bacterium]